jgi:hypothetical protein
MNLSDLGNIGEFIGSIAVIGSLIYVGYQIRQNTIATERSNARQTASDHARANFAIMDEKVADIVLRGLNNLGDLTPVERYRLDLAIAGWLEGIEQAFADYAQNNFKESSLKQYRTRILALLDTPGGRAWWKECDVWFSEEFQLDLNELLDIHTGEIDNASVLRDGTDR